MQIPVGTGAQSATARDGMRIAAGTMLVGSGASGTGIATGHPSFLCIAMAALAAPDLLSVGVSSCTAGLALLASGNPGNTLDQQLHFCAFIIVWQSSMSDKSFMRLCPETFLLVSMQAVLQCYWLGLSFCDDRYLLVFKHVTQVHQTHKYIRLQSHLGQQSAIVLIC